MGQREYVIAIEGDEQYRTASRSQAKAFYNVVDEIFDREVDGLRKQLIQVEADGWNSSVLLQDIIHCPKEKPDWEKDEDLKDEKPDFRVIIAGSWDFENYGLLREKCDALLSRQAHKNIIVVSGAARGADQLGEWYAHERGYKVERYPADWKTYGKAAGPIRNEKMADNADALIVFWDGESRGTRNMIETATFKGLSVRVVDALQVKKPSNDLTEKWMEVNPQQSSQVEEQEEEPDEEQTVRHGFRR